MPCYRCGARQVDPVRGHSPWQRGVKGDQQVLVCPDCQASFNWTAELDRCRQCGSVRLVRRLGEVECRECGFVVPQEEATGLADLGPGGPGAGVLVAAPSALPPAGASSAAGASSGAGVSPGVGGSSSGAGQALGAGQAPGLAEEVARALDRVLGRSAHKPSASASLSPDRA